MPTLNFRIVNVFTYRGGRLTGNPLCVFESATGLDTDTMQALARQFNLSETTFILPSSVASAQVRIFTPSYEMPFAGHPTLGTAFVCRALGLGGDQLKLEMKAGIIPVEAQGDRWTLQANAPTWRECDAPRAAVAAMLGLEVEDVGERPLWVKTGKEQLIVPLTSEAAVRRAVGLAGADDELAVDLLGIFKKGVDVELVPRGFRFLDPERADLHRLRAVGGLDRDLAGGDRDHVEGDERSGDRIRIGLQRGRGVGRAAVSTAHRLNAITLPSQSSATWMLS